MPFLFSLSKNLLFDRLAEVKEASKASNSHSSAYTDTVEGELRSKSKHLAQQELSQPLSQKSNGFLPAPLTQGSLLLPKPGFDGLGVL